MAKKKQVQLTSEQEKELKTLFSTYEMLEKTKQEMIERGKDDYIGGVVESQKEVIEKIEKIDSTRVKDLLNNKKMSQKNQINDIVIKDMPKKQKEVLFDINNVDRDMAYDIISLPSHGECYSNKLERIPVGYLTAYDENFITSPNLYRDGLVIDFLLKNKILNSEISVDELCSGDADAITLFLRATSYGIDFPITVRDPETNETIETTVDLTTLKYKDFTLKGDEDGYFDFELPISKDVIKFKFLTRGDEKKLKELSKIEQNGTMALTLMNCNKTLSDALENDTVLSGKEKQECNKLIDTVNEWIEKLHKDDSIQYNRLITNRMELSIMAVNGNYDKDYVKNYIYKMNAKDSLTLRRYIMENEPGVNFEIEVQRPESLGGGSFKTFLEWDDSIFLNFT